MSALYGSTHRRLQDENQTRRLADRLQEMAHDAFNDDERAFVESASMVFISTVDHEGRPTVSYKGGPPGFVHVVEPCRLVFPCYDGNGMYLSLGNIEASAKIGMLFIDFETPRRLRVQGEARILRDDAMLATHPGAKYLVAVTTSDIFVNCGRYIHKAEGLHLSTHIPDSAGRQPFPSWKRIDVFDDVLSEEDRCSVAHEGGVIAYEDYRGERL